MSRSFLHLEKLNEYFSSTVAFFRGSLVYIRAVEICDKTEEGYRLNVHFRRGDKQPPPYELTVSHYDEGIKVIRPFLPRTRFFQTAEGNHWLCGYTPSNNYKKSLCGNRYRQVALNIPNSEDCVIDSLDIRNTDSFREIQEKSVYEVLENIEGGKILTALSGDFAIYEGAGTKVPLIMYHNMPIAKINSIGSIEVHPRYYHSFSGPLSKFGEVVNADQ